MIDIEITENSSAAAIVSLCTCSRCLSARKYFLTAQKFDELAIFKASAIKRRTSIQLCTSYTINWIMEGQNIVFRLTLVSCILMDTMRTVLEIYLRTIHALFTIYYSYRYFTVWKH